MIKLYNSLSRKKEEFKPLHDKKVGLYTCGPTVYNYAHVGNLRTYIFEDILEKVLTYNGYDVKRVMNITDVGHLTSDADTGEDKIEREAREEGKTPESIAQFYTKAFLDDLKKLNVKIPKILAPATEHIPDQVEIIKVLFEKGLAYETDVAVYFDVKKYGFDKYLRLSRQPLEEKISGAREEVVIDQQKRNPVDFVLWFKLVGKFKNHVLRWPSPWGDGFPGWHIECSAISSKFLGQPFDIHAGGIDLIGTHHTNEIAQSEGAYGKPLAKLWMHGEFLLIDSSKMAKSEGNFFTLADLEKKGLHPLALRYLVLGAHYRSKLNFTWESLDAAKNGIERLYQTIYVYNQQIHDSNYDKSELISTRPTEDPNHYEQEFLTAINDDLNTPQALAVLHDMLDANMDPTYKLKLAGQFDRVLGLQLDIPTKVDLPEKVKEIREKIWKFRDNKQFIQSDALRKEVEGLGYSVRDTESGTMIIPRFF